jgi:hypothetical protein
MYSETLGKLLLALPFVAGEGEKSWKRRPIAVLTILLIAVALGTMRKPTQNSIGVLNSIFPTAVDLGRLAAIVLVPLPELHDGVGQQGKDDGEYCCRYRKHKDGQSKDRLARGGGRREDVCGTQRRSGSLGGDYTRGPEDNQECQEHAHSVQVFHAPHLHLIASLELPFWLHTGEFSGELVDDLEIHSNLIAVRRFLRNGCQLIVEG